MIVPIQKQPETRADYRYPPKMIIFYDLENEAKNDFFNYTMLQ